MILNALSLEITLLPLSLLKSVNHNLNIKVIKYCFFYQDIYPAFFVVYLGQFLLFRKNSVCATVFFLRHNSFRKVKVTYLATIC